MQQSTPVLVNMQSRTMTCPRCEREQPMRNYGMLGMSPFYAQLLAPIYRCGECSHLFAPRPLAFPEYQTA